MMVPAISKKEELERLFAEHAYDEGMFYYNASPYPCENRDKIELTDCLYQWACVDQGRVVGYFRYWIDTHTDTACQIGWYGFEDSSVLGADVYRLFKKLVKAHRRVEWGMVAGNPAQKTYDKLCKKFGGNRVTLHAVCKDGAGKYHDFYTYEILKEEC